ncbi:hypothetical protein ENUP19_0347G0002 [Entamoeba nuttalli]|uniref:General transcription factor IIH subunit 4 n=1 Tax=Entamoeba nuttalli TaxID=412467 RepID=A0ABQ0DXM9_9EUKA
MENNIIEKDIIKYFQVLPEIAMKSAYKSKWTCSEIFRLLPGMCQSLLLRIIFLTERISINEMYNQFKIPNETMDEVINTIHSIHIVDKEEENGILYIKLNNDFQSNFKMYLTGSMEPAYKIKEVNEKVSKIIQEKCIKENCIKTFEYFMNKLLQFNSQPNISNNPLRIFKDLELVKEETRQITRKGYQFLFQETKTQLWVIMLSIIGLIQRRISPFINDVFEMTYLKEHIIYNCDHFKKVYGPDPLQLFNDLGIIVYYKEQNVMAITPLMSLLRSNANIPSNLVKKPKTITEINYSVYIYTESQFQVDLYRLFIRKNFQLANLWVGKLNHQSVTEAFAKGITSEMLINFLQPNLPRTIQKQIDLWKKEINRFKEEHVVRYRFYDDAIGRQLFVIVKNESDRLKATILEKEDIRLIFVKYQYGETIRSFMKKKERELLLKQPRPSSTSLPLSLSTDNSKTNIHSGIKRNVPEGIKPKPSKKYIVD